MTTRTRRTIAQSAIVAASIATFVMAFVLLWSPQIATDGEVTMSGPMGSAIVDHHGIGAQAFGIECNIGARTGCEAAPQP